MEQPSKKPKSLLVRSKLCLRVLLRTMRTRPWLSAGAAMAVAVALDAATDVVVATAAVVAAGDVAAVAVGPRWNPK